MRSRLREVRCATVPAEIPWGENKKRSKIICSAYPGSRLRNKFSLSGAEAHNEREKAAGAGGRRTAGTVTVAHPFAAQG